ncbi:MAG TPA: DUF2911 domain-containing protein [Longimicrobiaceae bacterium]|nr:DUF2911 domain-containing protein [Longimicrobiaceae bacterium]
MASSHSSRLRGVAALGLPLAFAALPAPAAAQGAPETAAYVVRLGDDTVAVEEFTRSGGRVQGRQVVRTPRTQLREYSGTLRPDGTLADFQLAIRAPGAEQPAARAAVEFGADSATVRLTRGDSTQTFRMAAPAGSIPFLAYSVALYELPLARIASSRADSLALAMVPIGGPNPFELTVRRTGAGEYSVANIAGASRARADAQGRLLAWDGSGTTLQITSERLPRVALDSLATAFAARDQAGQGLGQTSPRDTVTAQLGAAAVSVDYSRPYRRGRTVFGGVVPWGQVWRTGANQATHLRTDRDLTIGGERVPAGTYTLWTVPGEREWTLILNRQTGQWGTEYDQAKDLVRVPMRVERAPQRAEQFTISLEPAGQGGVLAMTWDDTRATVPVAPAGS